MTSWTQESPGLPPFVEMSGMATGTIKSYNIVVCSNHFTDEYYSCYQRYPSGVQPGDLARFEDSDIQYYTGFPLLAAFDACIQFLHLDYKSVLPFAVNQWMPIPGKGNPVMIGRLS